MKKRIIVGIVALLIMLLGYFFVPAEPKGHSEMKAVKTNCEVEANGKNPCNQASELTNKK